MKELRSTCPICRHEWVVKHNHWGMGEIFLRIDFSIAMFDHLQSHTSMSRPIPYSYGKGVQETQDQVVVP